MIVLTGNGFGSPQAYSELSGVNLVPNLVPNLVDWLRLRCARNLCVTSFLRSKVKLMPRQQNLWVISGSGKSPMV